MNKVITELGGKSKEAGIKRIKICVFIPRIKAENTDVFGVQPSLRSNSHIHTWLLEKPCWCYFANKGPYSQSYGFSSGHVWMWELGHKEGWVPKNWCFWTVVLKKTLQNLWTARRSNQSIPKEINPDYSLKVLMLKLKLQYFGHLIWEPTHWKRPWCWKRLKAGEGDNRGRDGWMASPTQWTWVWVSSGRWWRTGKTGVLQSMELQRVGHDWATEQQ